MLQFILTGVERRDDCLKRLHRVAGGTLTKNWDGKSIPVVVGTMNGTDDIQVECRKQNIPYVYIDNGYFNRSNFLTYARYCFNNYHCTDWRTSDKKIPKMKKWKKDGKDIIVLSISPTTEKIYNVYGWLDNILEEIKKYTDRNIIIKDKDDPVPLAKYLENAHAVVSFTSVGDVESVLNGVPVYGSEFGPVVPITQPLSEIESPKYPDRTAWASSLAAAEWHQCKMEDCWKRLKYQVDPYLLDNKIF